MCHMSPQERFGVVVLCIFEGRRLAASASASPNLKRQALIVKRNGPTHMTGDYGNRQNVELSL